MMKGHCRALGPTGKRKKQKQEKRLGDIVLLTFCPGFGVSAYPQCLLQWGGTQGNRGLLFDLPVSWAQCSTYSGEFQPILVLHFR